MGRVESFGEHEWSLMIEIHKFGRIKEEKRNYRKSGIAGEIRALSHTQGCLFCSICLFMPLHYIHTSLSHMHTNRGVARLELELSVLTNRQLVIGVSIAEFACGFDRIASRIVGSF